eukprot:gene7457-9163_t
MNDQQQYRKSYHNNVIDFTAIYALERILSTSLGPKGLDKVTVNRRTGETIITNDGATILKNLPIKHPLALILKNLANSIDIKVGDGTTSGVLLACMESISIIKNKENGKVYENISSNIRYLKLLGGSISESRFIRGTIVKISNTTHIGSSNQFKKNYTPNQNVEAIHKVILLNFDLGYINESTYKLIQFNSLNINSLNDSLSILALSIENPKLVAGGGASEIEMSIRLNEYCNQLLSISSSELERKQFKDNLKYSKIIRLFAEALESIPIQLFSNAGYDSITMINDN